jgi:hypothetical protein
MNVIEISKLKNNCEFLLLCVHLFDLLFVFKCGFFFLREREKLTQRDELWQQVEMLAKNNPEWQKVVGQMHVIDLSTTE